MSCIYDGGSRTLAAKIGGVGLQIVRDWVLRFNEEGPEGLLDRKAPGKVPTLNDAQRAVLVEKIETGPLPYLDGVVRWRLVDLVQWLWEEFGLSISRQTLGRELRALGFRKLSARPQHYAQDPQAMVRFKKNFPAELRRIERRLGSVAELEIWFQDEARIGQKNKQIRRCSCGARPRAPHDQRTKSACIFGAICPEKSKAAGLVIPRCNTPAMQAHLEEISVLVAPGAHTVVLLDQAGWHTSKRLTLPNNVTLLLLPPRSPELNSVENLWQFLRDNWLSNRVFSAYDDIIVHCCEFWTKLLDQPWRIASIGLRDWAMSSNQ